MTHIVRLMVTMVQVGTNLWVNPTQIVEVKELIAPNLVVVNPPQIVEICAAGGSCYNSDWPIQQVLAALNDRKLRAEDDR